MYVGSSFTLMEGTMRQRQGDLEARSAPAVMEPVITGCVVKRLRVSCVVAACAVFFYASGARANDVSFGGSGADLVPLEQTSVRLVSEDIAL